MGSMDDIIFAKKLVKNTPLFSQAGVDPEKVKLIAAYQLEGNTVARFRSLMKVLQKLDKRGFNKLCLRKQWTDDDAKSNGDNHPATSGRVLSFFRRKYDFDDEKDFDRFVQDIRAGNRNLATQVGKCKRAIFNPKPVKSIYFETNAPEYTAPSVQNGPGIFGNTPNNPDKQGPAHEAPVLTLYHGTQKKFIPSIMKKGLVDEDGPISLTPNKGVAVYHAETGPEMGWGSGKYYYKDKVEPTVLKVKLPMKYITYDREILLPEEDIHKDKGESIKTAYEIRVNSPIPPKYIKEEDFEEFKREALRKAVNPEKYNFPTLTALKREGHYKEQTEEEKTAGFRRVFSGEPHDDNDRDGIINAEDSEPNNPEKQ